MLGDTGWALDVLGVIGRIIKVCSGGLVSVAWEEREAGGVGVWGV